MNEKDALHEDIIISWQYRMDALHTRLLNLLCTLDPDNIERARLGFPDHVCALERYRHEPGWWDDVQKRRIGDRTFKKTPKQNHHRSLDESVVRTETL